MWHGLHGQYTIGFTSVDLPRVFNAAMNAMPNVIVVCKNRLRLVTTMSVVGFSKMGSSSLPLHVVCGGWVGLICPANQSYWLGRSGSADHPPTWGLEEPP